LSDGVAAVRRRAGGGLRHRAEEGGSNPRDRQRLITGESDTAIRRVSVDLLRSRGKRVYLVTSRPTASRELSYVADKPIFFIEDFKAELQRDEAMSSRSTQP
jgi:uncharacterized LabA/DUF88 family protein